MRGSKTEQRAPRRRGGGRADEKGKKNEQACSRPRAGRAGNLTSRPSHKLFSLPGAPFPSLPLLLDL